MGSSGAWSHDRRKAYWTKLHRRKGLSRSGAGFSCPHVPGSSCERFFSGRVQGVGFRYQTLQLAKGFEVSGWVMNLPDGRVQLEVGVPCGVRWSARVTHPVPHGAALDLQGLLAALLRTHARSLNGPDPRSAGG